jgi:hypothetical protein
MATWYSVNFEKLVDYSFAKKTIFTEMLSLMKCVFKAFDKVQQTALYRMQHNGETVYLEKVLNDYYNIPGYNPVDHDGTKQIYIEDAETSLKLYIFQDTEVESSFMIVMMIYFLIMIMRVTAHLDLQYLFQTQLLLLRLF